MAKTPSVLNNPLSGNLGNQTFKDYGGVQVVTARVRTTSAKGAGASYDQRLRRILLPNLVLIASQFKDWLPILFERNIYYKRPYTHFISHNLNRELPAQPKEVIEVKKCHWGAVQVSCGSLPRVRVYEDGNAFFTEIPMPSGVEVSDMPMSTFTQTLIDSRMGFLDGDFLVFIEVNTTRSSTPSGSYDFSSSIRVGSLHLDLTSSTPVIDSWNGLGVSLRALTTSLGSTRLAVSEAMRRSVAMVHVRRSAGRWLSSTAEIVLGSQDFGYVSQSMTPEYIERVCQSYGYKPSVMR